MVDGLHFGSDCGETGRHFRPLFDWISLGLLSDPRADLLGEDELEMNSPLCFAHRSGNLEHRLLQTFDTQVTLGGGTGR